MKVIQGNLFADHVIRMQIDESLELTIQSLQAYGVRYKHWCAAWSGGKDSTTLVTLIVWLIKTGQIEAPETFTVMYADTRLELTPLYFAAQQIMHELRDLGIEVRTVTAPMEKRFLTYILGRGVPPPNNNTFRWCTRQIKIDPMKHELEKLFKDRGEKVLMLTGVRQGESAIRDRRIVMSCSKDGAECGQGWYQQTMPEDLCDTLAPLLHWRVCHIWDWLKIGPISLGYEFKDKSDRWHGFSTQMIADAYGGDEAEEINARTGCIGCPLAQKDTALDNLIKQEYWFYLEPLKRLKPLWRELRLPQNRLRKTGKETSEKNKQRMGPLIMECRKNAFDTIIKLQNDINKVAIAEGKPVVVLLNRQERLFIKSMWKINRWPNRWDGTEPTGDVLMDTVYSDGTVQPLLFG